MALNFIYPLDYSGSLASNRIEETHVLDNKEYRVVTFDHGPIYADDAEVYDEATTKKLTRGADYEFSYFIQSIAEKTAGLEPVGVLVIRNSKVSDNIRIIANFVGGPYAYAATVIKQAVDELEIDNGNVYWKNVYEKPELFQPAGHLHDIADIFGFEFVISVLGMIRDTLLTGSNTKADQLRDAVDVLEKDIRSIISKHEADYKNPHKVTAHQTDAYTQAEIDTKFNDILTKLNDLEPRFKKITSDISTINDNITSLKQTMSRFSNDYDVMSRNFNRGMEELGEVTEDILKINDEIAAIKIEIQNLHDRDDELKNFIDENKKAINVEKARNDEQDNEINDIVEVNNEQTQQIKALQNRMTSAEKRLATNESTLRTHTEQIADIYEKIKRIRPIGTFYIQFPGGQTPSALFGGVWELRFNTESIFFRTEGSLSTAFNGGIQSHAMMRLTGTMNVTYFSFGSTPSTSGVFYVTARHNRETKGGKGDSWAYHYQIAFDSSRVVPAANEVRPRNRTYRIWVKTGDD